MSSLSTDNLFPRVLTPRPGRAGPPPGQRINISPLSSENCLNSLFTVNLRSASHLNFQVQKVALSRAFIMQYCNILSLRKRLMENGRVVKNC